MAGRRYSAGRIFLQVVPSFDNLQRQIGQEVRKANSGLEKDHEELGEKLGQAQARGEEKAARAAHQRRRTQATKDAKDLTEIQDKFYVDPVIQRLKKLQNASDQVRIQENAKVVRDLMRQRAKEFEINEKARAREEEADRRRRSEHMAWVIKSTVEEQKRVAAEEERAARRSEQAQDKIRRRRIQSRLSDMRAMEAERRRLSGGDVGRRIRSGAQGAADAIGVMRIDVDSSDARRELAALREELLTISDANIGVDLDAGDALARMQLISARLKALSADDVEIDVDANATAALIQLKRVEEQIDQINRKQAGGGLMGMFMGLRGSAEDGANSFRVFNYRVLGLLLLLPLLPPLIASAAGGIGALATAAVGGAAGLGVLILGFTGLQDAISAMGDVQDNAAKDTLAASKTIRNASRAVRDAEQGVARARQQAARAAEDASRRVSDARRNAADAEREVARSIRDALRAQRDAEDDLARAQRDATDAQNDLMDARRQAQREQDDLADRIASGKLDERQALIDLFNAQVAYNAAMADGGATNLDREEAAIQLERAQLAMKGIRKENADLAEQQKKGIAGSETLASAQERVATTQERVRDAQQAVVDAEERTRDARLDGARRIADANRDVADAIRDQQQAAQDAAIAIRDAGERLNDSQVAYQEALTQTGEIGSSSMEKLRIAMGKLSPAGREFATFIFGLRDGFYRLRAIAQEGFLPGLQTMLEGLIARYGPSFSKFVGTMARVLGDFFINLGKALQSPVMVTFFETMAQYAPIFLQLWGDIGISFMKIIGGLMTAFAPFAKDFMTAFADMARGWADWAAGLKDNPAFQEFIDYVRKVGPKVLDLIGSIFQLVINIGIGLSENGMFDGIIAFFKYLADVDPKIIAAVVGGIVGLGIASQVSAGINSLIISFQLLTRTSIGLVTLGLFVIIAGLVLLYQNNEWFRDKVNRIWAAIKGYVETFVNWVRDEFLPWWRDEAQPIITRVFSAIGDAAEWLWVNILKPVFTMLWELVSYAFQLVAALWVNVLWPVLKAMFNIFLWLWEKALFPVISSIGSLFSDAIGVVKWVWDNVLKNVLDAIIKMLNGDFVGAWASAVKAIEGIWNGLKRIAAVPVNFIIETVLNNGLFKAFNSIMEFFGLDTRIKPLSPVTWGDAGGDGKAATRYATNKWQGEFYAGGWTGPGGKYDPAGVVHADEFVIRKEATNRIKANYGLEVLDFLNRYGELPTGYAIGGMVKPVNARPAFPWGRYPSGGRHRALDLQAASGTPIVSPYPSKVIKDGWDSTGFGNHVRLQAFGGGTGTFWILGHMLKEFVRVGQQVAAGQLLGLVGSTGRSTGPHLHLEGRMSPYNPDSSFDFTAAFNGGRAVTPAAGAATANLPWWASAPLDFVKSMVNAGLSKLPQAGIFDDLLRGGINKLMDGAGSFLARIVGGGDMTATDSMGGSFLSPTGEGLAYNGVQAFDSGGLLQPGVTTVLNMTGKPEPVFTDDQWREAPAGGATSLIGHLDLDVNGSELTAAEVMDEMMHVLTRVSHGGKYAGRTA